MNRGGIVGRLLASHLGEPGSIPGGVAPEFPHIQLIRLLFPIPLRDTPDFRMWESCRTMPLVGGCSRGPPVPPALSFRHFSPYSPRSLSSALKTSMLRAVQISSLTRLLFCNEPAVEATGARLVDVSGSRWNWVTCEVINLRIGRVSLSCGPSCLPACLPRLFNSTAHHYLCTPAGSSLQRKYSTTRGNADMLSAAKRADKGVSERTADNHEAHTTRKLRSAVRWSAARSCQVLLRPCLPEREVGSSQLKAVHDKVSTFEINRREKSLLLPAFILTAALSDIRPVKVERGGAGRSQAPLALRVTQHALSVGARRRWALTGPLSPACNTARLERRSEEALGAHRPP
ncbi:hypothetical protein PR048_032590 [Dryococelus australis]|uniref:Uncharacterized protein n=1 Tax=Dryococelus australis TaxID=614101 RepID=A0ABQ9G6Q9_9NEOP|nr:hypothetical protein PR048_032590 [Dryococelus australis]